MSPFSAWIWHTLSSAAIFSIALHRNSSETIRLPRFLYVMNILNDRTPSRTASARPSRIAGSCSRMKWKPKSTTDSLSACSRRRRVACGSVSPAVYFTNGTTLVSPVRAAASAATFQSSYSGPTCRWQSMRPGKTSFPVASMTRSAGGSHSSGASATMRPPWIATPASTTSLAVTTRPPFTTRSTARAVIGSRRGPRNGPPRPPALGAPRETRGAPRPYARSSVGLLLGDRRQQDFVVLGLATAEEVPALAHRRHPIEVDARSDELVAIRRRLGHDLALRIDHARAADELQAVLDAGLGHTDDEARVGVGARAHAEIVEIERQRRDRRVVADQDDLGALQRERAIALRVATILTNRDADARAGAVPHPVAGVAVGEVAGVVHLREAVGCLRARQSDFAKRPAEPSVTIGEERGVEVLAIGLLAESDVHGDPRLRRAPQQRLQSLRRHVGLEELVEVLADLLGEVCRERHFRIGDQLDALARSTFEQDEHALDDF